MCTAKEILENSEGVLVSHDAQIDSGVAVLLDSSQQGGAIAVPDLPRMEVIFWVQQLQRHMKRNIILEPLFIYSIAVLLFRSVEVKRNLVETIFISTIQL